MIKEINAMAIPGLSTIEDIAASIWEINKDQLNVKTRKREVVEARQTLMNYRNKHLGQTLRRSAEPYGFDHATTVHANITIGNLKETDHNFRNKHNEFLSRAKEIHL